MSKFLALIALPLCFFVGGVSLAAHGRTTRYWDCCKASCSWGEKAAVSNPVMTCAKDGITQVEHEMTNVCGGGGLPGKAYMCNNQQPWAINTSLAFGFAAAAIAGQNEAASCCACYELKFTTGPVANKIMVVQVTNTGGDLGSNHFDLQMPGGGVGIYNGCTDQWAAGADGWGARYGGVANKAACSTLPTQLQAGCNWHFDWFMSADNPEVDLERVHCPKSLLDKTKCERTDEKSQTNTKYSAM